MQTCGAKPRGVRVEWLDGGGRTHLVGVTELGSMLGNDPNQALSVLHELCRWEGGRSAGHGPAAQGLGEVAGPGRGDQQQQQQQQSEQQHQP